MAVPVMVMKKQKQRKAMPEVISNQLRALGGISRQIITSAPVNAPIEQKISCRGKQKNSRALCL